MRTYLPNYKVNRLRDKKGNTYYYVRVNGQSTMISKHGKFFKPHGRQYPYCKTLRDAIVHVAYGV
ncbi:hypothetical protein NVP1188A_74 [Vibrio phage 1.188.A._10N.286.51.A6]|uniref:Uncharacterized protein n=3 Tax=Mukerjeevirus mv51A6 TaxID=2734162 RepID=A0A2I7RJ29_9CAUD|nr:hypothetical protein HOU77_gp32 [Vibrio phage 1.188.A._10N.286.51.A6]AUR93642.1 hypothetical protein NVP1188A_74 [Vibrio phage 1.188.A._10N.286.51.A6]AUR93728.1 hypothetical protein NVP1188B_74 [Vibrio phage 1.188.B._10N.286.51.A6]AUR93814.1 hypothetical protein NVP1188C_74 [Vibrio phage 1.188.C._10N.286.51.A6]